MIMPNRYTGIKNLVNILPLNIQVVLEFKFLEKTIIFMIILNKYYYPGGKDSHNSITYTLKNEKLWYLNMHLGLVVALDKTMYQIELIIIYTQVLF